MLQRLYFTKVVVKIKEIVSISVTALFILYELPYLKKVLDYISDF